MRSAIIILLSVFVLSGCSLASHTVKDVDKHIVAITADGTASTDCIAGFYSGIAFGTDNLKIARATQALDALADTNAADYKRCKAKGLEVSILAISGRENLDEIVKRIVGLGLF